MAVLQRLAAWTGSHPDLAELGAGTLALLSVVAISLSQWGLTDTGLTRGLILGLVMGLAVVWTYRSRRRREERRERDLREQRLRLARELHDSVAGQVALIGVQAAGARRVIGASPERADAALEVIEAASRTAVADLQRMLLTLRDGAALQRAPEPGLADLDEFMELARRGGQPLELRVDGALASTLEPSLDHAAYRIVAEGVTNAIKHAPGAATRVTITYRPAALDLSVVNAPAVRAVVASSRARAGGGLGIIGVTERSAIFGGVVSAGATPDGGWELRAVLPLEVRAKGVSG